MSLPLHPDQSSAAGPATGAAPRRDHGLGPAAYRPSPGVPAQPETAPRRSRPSGRRRPTASPDVELQIRLFRVTDPIAVVGALLLVFLVTNLGHLLTRAEEFLGLRITVKNVLLLCVFALAWRLLSVLTGLYDWEKLRTRREESLRVLLTCTLASTVALGFPAISVTGGFRWSAVLWFWLGGTLTILGLRSLIRLLVPRHSAVTRHVLIVGAGRRGQRLHGELRANRTSEYKILGFVDSELHDAGGTGGGLLGGLEDLEQVLDAQRGGRGVHRAADQVPLHRDPAGHAELRASRREGQVPGRSVRGHRLRQRGGGRPGGAGRVAPRSRGLAPAWPSGASTSSAPRPVLLVLSPVLLLAAVAIKLTSRGPVLFAQDRYGLNRRLFKMYKLRTMVADAEALQAALESQNEATGPVFKIRDDPRITPVGRLLRRTSHRRAAAAGECAPGRHVAGGTAAAADARRAPVHRGRPDASLQRAAGAHLPVADQRSQRS